MGVALDEFPDCEAIRGFLRGDRNVVAHESSPGSICLVHRENLFENGPRFKIRLDPECSEFAAEAGMLESAEWSLLIVYQAIDCYSAGLDMRCDAACALNVRAAHVSVEAILRIV